MTDITAYQIGAVFLLAALFMAGTLTRGLFRTHIFDNVKVTLFVVAAVLIGFAVYRGLPDISRLFNSAAESPSPGPAALAPGVPIKRNDTPLPQAIKTRETQAQTTHQALPVQGVASPPNVVLHLAVDPPSSTAITPQPEASSQPGSATATFAPASMPEPRTQESGNRVKRVIKSVGHFLHIGHEQYQPAPSVPERYEPGTAAPQPTTPLDQGKADEAK